MDFQIGVAECIDYRGTGVVVLLESVDYYMIADIVLLTPRTRMLLMSLCVPLTTAISLRIYVGCWKDAEHRCLETSSDKRKTPSAGV
jgi:hypothetical protein